MGSRAEIYGGLYEGLDVAGEFLVERDGRRVVWIAERGMGWVDEGWFVEVGCCIEKRLRRGGLCSVSGGGWMSSFLPRERCVVDRRKTGGESGCCRPAGKSI